MARSYSSILGLMVVLTVAAIAALAEPALAADVNCSALRGDGHAVSSITQTATIILDDGREVGLAGVLLPLDEDSAALRALVGPNGVDVAVAADSKTDRYGRSNAHVFVERSGERIWVQRALVSEGHAIVSSRQAGLACLPELLAAEETARKEKRGLWANAAYRVHNATEPGALSRLRSHFVLVEGKVISTTERAGRLYLNFGGDWRTDFTVSVPKTLLTSASDTRAKLTALTGHTIRARGWIERRYGPAIEIYSLHDVEDLTPATAAVSGSKP